MAQGMKTEVVQAHALRAMQRAEIDSLVTTAKEYPRDIDRSLDRIRAMALRDQFTAEQCYYTLPRKDKNGRRINITGPSVRFAEILASQWGNLRCAARIVEIGSKEVVAQGVCIDLETNVGYDVEVRAAIVSPKTGKRYSDDMITTTANATAAKAFRNAVLKAVPQPLWRETYESTLKKLGGKTRPLADSWQRAISWFASRGVTESQLRQELGIKSPKEITQKHIQELRGWRNAIEQDAASVEEIFGDQDHEPSEEQPASRKPAKEVKADPRPEPTDEEQAETQAAWSEWEKIRGGLDMDGIVECRRAAGVDYINKQCSLEQLNEAIGCATEILRANGGEADA